MNEFKTCDQCSGFNGKSVAERLKKLDENAELIVGCQGLCAIGAKMPFVIVNGIIITADNEDELIERVKESMIK
ncbi:MAG: DUF1450 domain-containing protein [Bacilli bacterium]|nr:DUF1450 domain-containing protein [Bacilli bacterium]